MVTRKGGDGPPDEKPAGDRPGSYAKIASSRRRRRGRRSGARSSNAPPGRSESPGEHAGANAASAGETFEPPVDDLRRSSSRAARRPGPLGLSDPPSNAAVELEPPAYAPAAPSVMVVEVGSAAPSSDNTNDQPHTESHERPLSDAPHADAGGLDDGAAPGAPTLDWPSSEGAAPPSPPDHPEDAPDAGPLEPVDGPRPREGRVAGAGFVMGSAPPPPSAPESEVPRSGFSSVLGARASLRPSPPPPPSNRLGWALVIVLLCSIIGAAVAVAVRERMDGERAEQATPPEDEEPSEPAPAAAPEREAPAEAEGPSPASSALEESLPAAEVEAGVPEAGAPALRARPQPPPRMARPRRPGPVAPTSAAPATPTPTPAASDAAWGVPPNPYAEPPPPR